MEVRFAERAKTLKPSDIRNKLFDDPELISFAAGRPEGTLFPANEILPLITDIVQNDSQEALQYSSTEGFKQLREIIAAQRMKDVGVNATADNITLVSGCQQGIEFSAKIFVNQGDVLICEKPTFEGALNAFRPYQPKYVGISMDKDGMVIEELENALKEHPNAKMIYTIPDFQNPTGRYMSIDRRMKLAEIGAKYKIPVIEDRPYGDLIYEGVRHPAVKSFDKDGWVVFLGSFSKTFCPGLRLGWVCASDAILKKYSLAKLASDLQCGTLDQKIAIVYMSKYDLNDHIEVLKNVYRERLNLMMECIREYFPKEVKHTAPKGGFFVWLELKEGINAGELLLEAAQKAKVVFVPGGAFFTESGYDNFIRLSYSSVGKDKIVEGMKRLGGLLCKYY